MKKLLLLILVGASLSSCVAGKACKGGYSKTPKPGRGQTECASSKNRSASFGF